MRKRDTPQFADNNKHPFTELVHYLLNTQYFAYII